MELELVKCRLVLKLSQKNFYYFFISFRAEGPGWELLKHPPSVCLPVHHVSFSHCSSKTHCCISSKLPIWPDFTFSQFVIWIWVSNDQIWLPRAHMSDFEQCLKLTFSKFSVVRKPIINGWTIRPGGLLFMIILNIEKNNILRIFFSIFHVFFALHTICNIKNKIGVQNSDGGLHILCYFQHSNKYILKSSPSLTG